MYSLNDGKQVIITYILGRGQSKLDNNYHRYKY